MFRTEAGQVLGAWGHGVMGVGVLARVGAGLQGVLPKSIVSVVSQPETAGKFREHAHPADPVCVLPRSLFVARQLATRSLAGIGRGTRRLFLVTA